MGLFFPGAAPAPIFLGSAFAFNNGTPRITTVADAPAGSTIVLFYAPTNSTTTYSMATPTDSVGNVYTPDVAVQGQESTNGLYMARCENCAHLPIGSAISSVSSGTDDNRAAMIMAFAMPPWIIRAPGPDAIANNGGGIGTSSSALSSGPFAQGYEYAFGFVSFGNGSNGNGAGFNQTGNWRKLASLDCGPFADSQYGSLWAGGQITKSAAAITLSGVWPHPVWWAQGIYSFKLR